MFIKVLTAIAHEKFSDIHLHEGELPRWRTGGGDIELIPNAEPITAKDFEMILQSSVSAEDRGGDLKVQERLVKFGGDIDLAATIGDTRFRISMYWHGDRKLGASMRKVEKVIPKLETLGLPDYILKIIDRRNGIIFVTGETNSGKSTTLAAFVDFFAKRLVHIITVENPVEFVHQSRSPGALISQREVGAGKDAESFDRALRAALREDPDIILVGEIRDRETAEVALTAADTGHLVLCSLHTRSGPSTIERLMNLFPAEKQNAILGQLASSFVLCLSQTLIKSVEGNSRVLAYEIMTNTGSIAANIQKGKIRQLVQDITDARGDGEMCTMNHTLDRLVREQRITAESARRASYDPTNLHV